MTDVDFFTPGARLALELECLLMDTRNDAAQSRWWASAHKALEQWRQAVRAMEAADAAPQQPAATSETVNVIGMPEFDGLLDHIYEHGTAAEGVIEKANAFARAVIARYAPQQPAAVDEVKETDLWRCTVCGRVGTVGRCCGEETRERVNMEQLLAENERLQAEVKQLQADLAESDEIREKLGYLLTRTAAALKGEPPAGVWHSWHDLPERAALATRLADDAAESVICTVGRSPRERQRVLYPEQIAADPYLGDAIAHLEWRGIAKAVREDDRVTVIFEEQRPNEGEQQ